MSPLMSSLMSPVMSFHIASHIVLLMSPNIPSVLSLLWSQASVSHYVRFSSRWGAQLHIPTSYKVAAPAQDEKEKMKNNNGIYFFFKTPVKEDSYCQTFCFSSDHRNHQEELHAVTRVTRHTPAAEDLSVLGAGHYHRCYSSYRRNRTVQEAGSQA